MLALKHKGFWQAGCLFGLAATLVAAGFPEFLVLQRDGDQQAFRKWFTYLAEIQAYQTPPTPEVTDCASLVRFAYREALRRHDGEWASRLNLPLMPGLPSVKKYQYPYTPLKANLFRIGDDRFAEFADAKTLRQYNTYFVTRDVQRARPGDLLFYRQLFQAMPYHVMVYLGPSQVEEGVAKPYVVYHTGPMHGGPGEIRRVTVADLLRHPAPQWRPEPGNSNFLGIYRWDILPGGNS